MSFIIVYIANPDKKTAEKIAAHLLENKLAACVNIFPVESAYRWHGKIERAKEFVALAKTARENFGKIKQEIKKIHPYECPEILSLRGACSRLFKPLGLKIVKIEAEANEEYENWVKKELSSQ